MPETPYWSKRKDMQYLQVATNQVRALATQGSLLDVGGGVQRGCEYLTWLPEFDRTVIDIDPDQGLRLPDVEFHFGDFLAWQPDRQYDIGLCLQVIEHVPDPVAFAQHLFACCRQVVLSYPYRWLAGKCKEHLHDPIDEKLVERWTGRSPSRYEIVKDRRWRRLVATYS